MLEKLKDIICEYADADRETITAQSSLRNDFNLNSLDIINIAVAIEDETGVAITDRQMATLYTLGEVAEYIENAQA